MYMYIVFVHVIGLSVNLYIHCTCTCINTRICYTFDEDWLCRLAEAPDTPSHCAGHDGHSRPGGQECAD